MEILIVNEDSDVFKSHGRILTLGSEATKGHGYILSDPEYINIVYICLHANYLNKISLNQKVMGIFTVNENSEVTKSHGDVDC